MRGTVGAPEKKRSNFENETNFSHGSFDAASIHARCDGVSAHVVEMNDELQVWPGGC